jgi:hypothetical protein
MATVGRLVLLCALALMALSAGWSGAARACSCVEPAEGFVFGAKTRVPSNTKAVPWWGNVSDFVKDDGIRPVVRRPRKLPPKTLFRFEVLESRGPRGIDFDLAFAPESFPDRASQPWGRRLVLLQPHAPLRPDATYRLSFRQRKFSKYGLPTLTNEVQVIEVSVDAEPLLISNVTPALTLGKQVMGPLAVRKGATCTTTIPAAQQPLSFELPPPTEKWRGALLYAVTVDGTRGWRPARDNCADIPHGTSWVGQGKELLFVGCSEERVPEPLPEGDHLVTMLAWLPGTDVLFKAERQVSLRCR